MYVHVCVQVYYIYKHTRVYIYMYTCVYKFTIYTQTHVCTHACTRVCISLLYIQTHTYEHMYVHVCVHFHRVIPKTQGDDDRPVSGTGSKEVPTAESPVGSQTRRVW